MPFDGHAPDWLELKRPYETFGRRDSTPDGHGHLNNVSIFTLSVRWYDYWRPIALSGA